MDLDPGLQRAFDKVELVSGSIGDPGQGRMCLMSLVAFLAGESHSDAPGCASPLIQAFAVAINDHMPHAARQRLKPFAPRIIGTNDGSDEVRAAVLLHALADADLAGAPGRDLARAAAPAGGGSFAQLRRLWRWLRKDERQRLLHRALSHHDGVYLAREAARLIARSARHAADARERERHWDAAIGLLDRLCDTGAPAQRRGPGVRAERLARLEDTPWSRRVAPGREEWKSAPHVLL
jgi:hypothetical protein